MVKPSAIIVVGASEGGVEALSVLAAGLPSEFGAAVFVVLHIGAHSSQLPALLSERGPLPACHPKPGTRSAPATSTSRRPITTWCWTQGASG